MYSRLLCALSLLFLAGQSLGDTVLLNQMVDQLLSGADQQIAAEGKDTITIDEMNHDWQYSALSLLFLAGQSLGDTLLLNQVVDQLLSGVDQQLAAEGKDTITIDEMKHDWKYRWHFVKLSGHVNCHDGYAKSLASLRRTGDVTMTTNGNAITLKAALGLGQLDFGFEKCQFKASHLFSVTQHIKASVSSNSIEAQVTLVKNGDQCTATVDRLELAQLGKISVNTGGGVLHKIEDKILDWMAKHFHDKVVNSVNSALQKTAADNIAKADLCDKIPH